MNPFKHVTTPADLPHNHESPDTVVTNEISTDCAVNAEALRKELEKIKDELHRTKEELNRTKEELNRRDSALKEAHEEQIIGVYGIAGDVTAKKLQEEKQRELHRDIELLLESTGEGIYGIDTSGNCTFMNKAAANMLGYKVQQLIGRNIHDLAHSKKRNGEFYPSSECPIYNSMINNLGCEVDNEVLWRADGSSFDARYSSYPIVDNNIRKGAVITFSDISEKVKSQAELQKAINELNKIMASSLDVICSFDESGRFTQVSAAAEQVWGYKPQELIGKKYTFMVHEDDLADTQRTAVDIMAGFPRTNFENRYIRKDGLAVPIVWSARWDAEDRVMYCIAKDASEKKNAERALMQSEERYRTLFYSNPLPMWIFDFETRAFLEVNDAAIEHYGYSREEFLSMTLMDIRPKEGIEELEKVLKIRAGSKDIHHGISKHIKKNGEIIQVEVTSHDMKYNGKRVNLVLLNDISSRLEAERQKEFEQRNKEALINSTEDLIWSVSRDFKLIGANNAFLEWIQEYSGMACSPGDKLLIEKIFSEDMLRFWKELYQQALMGKFLIEELYIPARESTTQKWIEIRMNPIQYRQQVIGVACYVRDITENKEYAIKIKDSEEKYRTIFNFSPLPKWIFEMDSLRILEVNEAATIQYGYSSEDFLNKTISDIHPAQEVESLVKTFKEADQAGTIYFGKWLHKKAQGEIIHVEISGHLITYNGKESMMILANDITERLKAEKDLHHFFEVSRDLLSISSLDAYFQKINPSFSRLLGFTENELLSQPYTSLIHPHDLDTAIATLNEFKKSSETFSFENRYITKSGEYKWLSWVTQPIPEEGLVFAVARDVTEKKKDELKLLQFKNVIESSRDGIGILKKNGGLLFLNQAFCDFLGHTRESLRAAGGGLTPYKDKKNAEKIFLIAASGGYWNGDIQLIGKDGNLVDFYMSTGPVKNTDGEIIAVYGIHTNISIRKMLERELLAYNNRITTILESITDGFYSVDKNWIVTYWNKEAEILLQINREDILGKNIWDVFTEAIALKFYSEFHKAIKKNQAIHFEEFFPPLDKWFELSVYPSESGLSVYFKNITERKNAEKVIRTSNERYDIVAKVTNDAIWDWDLKQNKIYWNESLKTLFNYDPGNANENIDWWLDRIHPDDQQKVKDDIYANIASGMIYWAKEYRFRASDGSYRYIYDRAFSILDEDGKVIRMIGAMQDITRVTEQNIALQKRAEELARSNAELEQFAYIASHDLQEPLRMVTSFLKQLEKKYHEQLDETASKYIWFAVDGAIRMRKIILDLLEYSRAGRPAYDFEIIETNELLEEMAKLNRTIINEHKAVIEWNNLPVIYAAKTPIQQVFQNLVGNAIKYHKKGQPPLIMVSAIEIPGFWQFSISDNGIGIDPQFFEKIFIIFQRLHHRDEYSGTGIGLAICKKIIEYHKGSIWLESEPGKGSTFYFTIPKGDRESSIVNRES